MRVNAASRDLILDYLDRCGERTAARIQAYMTTMHRVSAGATRTQLCRLVRAGRIERTGQDHYQRKAAVKEMRQKALTEVIDVFSAAVAALAEHAPADARARLQQATGDLLEALATAAQEQAGGAALGVLDTVEKCRAELKRLRDRVKEDESSQAHINQMLIDLLVAQGEPIELGKEAL